MPNFEIRRYPYSDRFAVQAEVEAKLSPGLEPLSDPARRLTEGEVLVLVVVTPPETERGERATERMVHGGPPL
jgi:hypothetical protein